MSDIPPKIPHWTWPTPEEPWTIIHGDCMSAYRRLPDGCFDHCVTDPPYGIGFSSMQRTQNTEGFDKVLNDERPFVWFLYDAHRLVKEGGCLLCFTRWDVAEAFRMAITWAGFEVKAQLIWDKENHSMGDLEGAPGSSHEMAWFATKGKYKLPGKRPRTVVRVARRAGEKMVHPTQKPQGLLEELLKQYTSVGDTILEPFGGSGSTARAAIATGRYCVSTELSDQFVTEQRKLYARWKAGRESGMVFEPETKYTAPDLLED